MAWRVVDDALAQQMYDRMAALGDKLRPNTFVLPNYPSYDDMELDPPYTGAATLEAHSGLDHCVSSLPLYISLPLLSF